MHSENLLKRQRLTWPLENRFTKFICIFVIVRAYVCVCVKLSFGIGQFHKIYKLNSNKKLFDWFQRYLTIIPTHTESDIVTIYKPNTLSKFQTLFEYIFYLLQIARFSCYIFLDSNPSTNGGMQLKIASNNIVWPPYRSFNIFANKSLSLRVHDIVQCTCDSIALNLCIGQCRVLDQRVRHASGAHIKPRPYIPGGNDMYNKKKSGKVNITQQIINHPV